MCFGLYVLPRRRSGLDPWAYSAGMGLMVLILGAGTWLALALAGHGHYTPVDLARCAVSGAVWFLSNVAYILAIDHAGVARANAIKNLTALFGTVFGVMAGERLAPLQALAAFSGSAAIVSAAALIGTTRRGAGLRGQGPTAAPAFGVIMGLLAAAGIGYYLVPALPLVAGGAWGWVRYQAALGVFGGTLSIAPHAFRRLLRRGEPLPARGRALGLPVLAGALWFAGSCLVTPAAKLVGLAISWPLSQLSFYVTLAWGVRVFDEIDWARSRPAVWAGAALTLVALVLFGWAKA